MQDQFCYKLLVFSLGVAFKLCQLHIFIINDNYTLMLSTSKKTVILAGKSDRCLMIPSIRIKESPQFLSSKLMDKMLLIYIFDWIYYSYLAFEYSFFKRRQWNKIGEDLEKQLGCSAFQIICITKYWSISIL